MTPLPVVQGPGLLNRIRALIPESAREGWYRIAGGVVAFLAAFGLLEQQEAALWTQLVISVITLGFALIYATSTWRVVLYAVTGPLGGVLMFYGLVNDVRWAAITASVAYAFGITTAAAKTVQAPASLP
jgi:hypothetical protein